MNQNQNEVRTIFISKNELQVENLNSYLLHHNFNSTVKTKTPPSKVEQTRFSHLEPKYPLYYLVVPAQEQYKAFEFGKTYAVDNELDDIICCYPNLDFDTVKNIREREYGLTK